VITRGTAHFDSAAGSRWIAAATLAAAVLASGPSGAQERACAAGGDCPAGRGWVSGKTGPTWAEFRWVRGERVIEGDIVVDPVSSQSTLSLGQSAAIASGPIELWPGGVVPYALHPSLADVERVHDAIAHWHARTGISLVPRSTEADYLHFEPGDGCSSFVGMRGGVQAIRLHPACDTGSVIHEIGHAVGLWHEQSRHDRDAHIEVRFENIEEGRAHNFEKYAEGAGADAGPYDFGSIMHYPAWAFSRNGHHTIVPRSTLPAGVVLGQRDGLSAGDVAGVEALYGLSPAAPLESGEPVAGLSAARGEERHFRIVVPEDSARLEIQVSGGNGDADLYVRFDERPTRQHFDCRPYIGGNLESCSFDAPAAGTWFVMLRGYDAFAQVTLVAQTLDAEASGGLLDNGIELAGLSGARSEELHFHVDLPEATRQLEVRVRGGRGDADLYLRHGEAPTRTRFDCRPYRAGNEEICRVAAPAAGRWFVMLRGWSSFSGAFLLASHDGETGSPEALENGIVRVGLDGAQGEDLHFRIEVPAGAALLQVASGGGSGDADLYLRFGEAPTESLYDCRPYATGNEEACAVVAPSAGTWFLMLRGWASFADLSLFAEYL